MATDPNRIDGRTAALFALAIAMMVALVVAWRIDAEATTTPPEVSYELAIINEQGEPVAGASVTYAGDTAITGANGFVTLHLSGPELAIVEANGMLADGVVVGSRGETEVTLRLLAETGPGGDRTVMHFAGDFMLGRRYLDDVDRDPLVYDEESARSIVSSIAPLFELADVSMVNLETVVGSLAIEDAHPGNRYLLQSPTTALAAIDELGVDLVTLGNNHIYDWMDAGLVSTTRALQEVGVAYAGAGLSPAQAAQPALAQVNGLTVGVVSMTTLTGEYVNDRLPDATAPEPAALEELDKWQYEQREFGFGAPGETTYLELGRHRPGPVWDWFRDLEEDLSAADGVELWKQITRTFPELQDLVARRGHGGAAHYSIESMTQAIADARAAGADLVVAQLHGGYQFVEVGTDYFGKATRAAVDAGADLVIGHHPHVLQGFEIYEDTLIAYSLGNFVFDQDFIFTHPSVVLRTVFEGTEMIEASLYPVMVDGYRPVAAGGDVAAQILNQINLASLQDAVSDRFPGQHIGLVRTNAPVTASIEIDQGRGYVVPATAETTAEVAVAAQPVPSPAPLIQVTHDTPGLTVGHDLFGYGALEDVVADGANMGGLEWSVPPGSMKVDETSPEGAWVVRLDRTSQHLADAVAGTAGRLAAPQHRWFDQDGNPEDGLPSYSLRVFGKRVGAGIPYARVTYYRFDDTDVTREPISERLSSVDVQLPLVNDGDWHQLWVEVPALPEGANSMRVQLVLSPPESQSGTIWLDGLEVVEWRLTGDIPAGTWIQADYLRSDNSGQRTLTVAGSG